MRKTLIIGGESSVGRELKAKLDPLKNVVVFSTTRTQKTSSKTIFFDLTQNENFLGSEDFDNAIICVGITGITFCENNKDLAWEINVAATKNLIRYLVSRGIHTTVLSTSCVFEGRTIPCGVWSRTTPQSVYAKTKCALEEAIKFNFSDQCAVVRITKIVPHDWNMHQIWKTEYLQNGIVKPYGNKIMHPVTATKAVAKIIQISKNQRSGLFHLGSEHSISFLITVLRMR